MCTDDFRCLTFAFRFDSMTVPYVFPTLIAEYTLFLLLTAMEQERLEKWHVAINTHYTFKTHPSYKEVLRSLTFIFTAGVSAGYPSRKSYKHARTSSGLPICFPISSDSFTHSRHSWLTFILHCVSFITMLEEMCIRDSFNEVSNSFYIWRRYTVRLDGDGRTTRFDSSYIKAVSYTHLDVYKRQAQNIVLRGSVESRSGEKILGASIFAKDTQKGTTTDKEGIFTLQCDSNTVLQVSYVGYKTRQVSVNGRSTI